MAIYKISDILESIQSMKKDGFEYIEISECEADEDSEATLFIDAIEDEYSTESDMIDSVKLPSGYICHEQ